MRLMAKKKSSKEELELELGEEEETEEEEGSDDNAGAVLSTTAGVIVGGVATSGAGIAAGSCAAGGLAGYFTGVAATVGAIGCEAAAIGTLAVIAAGPLLGGLIAYTGYKAITGSMRRKDG